MIPKIIHIYWSNKETPRIVQFCIENIKKRSKKYKVIQYNEDFFQSLPRTKYFSKYLTKDQHKADYVRLYVLQKYGGIWMDASQILNNDIYNIIQDNEESNKLLCFPSVIVRGNIETCFLACEKNNNFVRKWWKEYEMACTIGLWEYKKLNEKYYGKHFSSYLSLNASFAKILHSFKMEENQRSSYYIKPLSKLYSYSHPMYYLIKNNWNSKKSLEEICEKDKLKKYKIIKLRSIERFVLEKSKTCNLLFL